MTSVHSVSLMAFKGAYFLLLNEFRRVSFKRKDWVWHPVGGKVEPGETPLEALEREWQEETGLPVMFPSLDTYTDFELTNGRVHRFYIWHVKGYLDVSGFVATQTTRHLTFRKIDSSKISDLTCKFIAKMGGSIKNVPSRLPKDTPSSHSDSLFGTSPGARGSTSSPNSGPDLFSTRSTVEAIPDISRLLTEMKI